MATKAVKKKAAKGKPAAASANPDAPRIVPMKGGLTAAALVKETLFTMEDGLRISQAQAKDFVASLQAVIDRELQEGNPINLFGYVKIVPRFHTKGKRLVNKVFGDPESGKITKTYPAKVSLKLSALKPLKDNMPSAAKLGRKV